MPNLVWFRNDLRVNDNPALFQACKDKDKKIIALFLITPQQWQKHYFSKKKITFIYKNLIELEKSLNNLNIPFFIKKCQYFQDSIFFLKNFCLEKKIKAIYYNKQYELNEIKRDKKIQLLLKNEIEFYSFDGNTLFTPGIIKNTKNKMYNIFSMFYKKCINKLHDDKIISFPIPQRRKKNNLKNNKKNNFDCYLLKKIIFHVGEQSANKKLEKFCSKIKNYINYRNIPFEDNTSLISPYLSIGIISPKQCINFFINKYSIKILQKEYFLIWLKELIWREFYYHLIFVYPFLCKGKPFIKWTDYIPWENNQIMLNAWKNGKTGYPIVDAGMRQLNNIGWMHNRMRMITANFLTKNLLIDWRLGEKYFMSKLIDGDFASNNGGWQWSASTGTDSVPYFRMFNPILQSKKFDPEGKFIKKWIPELSIVPNKYIHNPITWLKKNNLLINYPVPIIDHKITRKNTLDIFKKTYEKYQKNK